MCIVCLQEAHVVTERHLERGKSVAALLAAGARAWPTWGELLSGDTLRVPATAGREKAEKKNGGSSASRTLHYHRSRSARVTLAHRRIRDCLPSGLQRAQEAQFGGGAAPARFSAPPASRPWACVSHDTGSSSAKRDVSVVLKRHKVARVGGLVVNRDLEPASWATRAV